MTITEFAVKHKGDNEGLGTLFISDARLLVRPRKILGQYPASVKHDTIHSDYMLSLGNTMGKDQQWHIVYKGNSTIAQQQLNGVFFAYVDRCCLQRCCDARVRYIVNGTVVHVKEYGFNEGQYTMIFNVYCGIAEDQTEEFLGTLIAKEKDRFIVVRPDISIFGYSLHGFSVDPSEEDNFDDFAGMYDEECLFGCGQPAYTCTCA